MTIGAALALLLAAAPADLAEARSAFAAGEYARAAELALSLDAAGDRADARYVAGLARFREGRPREALELLDAAEAGADSPAAWRFNRGACLAALGRQEEAEASFLAAADDATFAALARIEAGWAALQAGASGRARQHLEAARAGGDAKAEPLVAELEVALATEAPAAAAPAPPAAQPESAASGRTEAFVGGGQLGGGWDGDALETSTARLERPGVASVKAPSAYALASAWQSSRWRWGGAAVEATYGFGQLAYEAPAARDRSLQTLDLSLSVRGRPADSLRVEGGLFSQWALAGLADLRGMQLAAGGRAAAAWELAPGDSIVGEAMWTAKRALSGEFDYLAGDRLDLALGGEGRWSAVTLRGGYRFQFERIGALMQPAPPVGPSPICPVGCRAVEVNPLSYAGHGGMLAARLQPMAWLRLDLEGAVQWRDYLDPAYPLFVRPDGSTAPGRARDRTEWRWSTGAGATALLAPNASVTVRYSWQGSRSTLTYGPLPGACPPLGGPCTTPPPGGTSWDKQVVELAAAVGW